MDMEVETKTWMVQPFQIAECLESMHSDIVVLEDLQKDNTSFSYNMHIISILR